MALRSLRGDIDGFRFLPLGFHQNINFRIGLQSPSLQEALLRTSLLLFADFVGHCIYLRLRQCRSLPS